MTTTTAAAAKNGDPLGHPGFLRREEEEEAVVGEERYDSDSDDDGDVDRYVFVARQPAPAEARDDDDGAIPSGGGGGPGRRRRRSEIMAKKARLGLAAPRDASISEGAVRSAERGVVVDQGKKNKKRRRCGGEPQVQPAARGERSSSGVEREASEGSQHRDVTAGQKTASAAAAGAPRRFVCSLCGRCFGSHQALGGHVHLGHTKKAKNAIAIAAASHGDVASNVCTDEMVAMADGAVGHGKGKTAVAASPWESDGDGNKTLGAAACHQDVDNSSGDSDSSSNEEKMFIGAADLQGDHRGVGNVEGEKVTVATATSRDGTASKLAVGRCHELTAGAIGYANSIVRKTRHRCEVCGKECLSGQALGGHMRKHRKLSPHNGGKERTSPELADGAGRHGQEKTAVAASHGKSHGDGTLGAEACHQIHVDSSSGDSNSNEEQMFVGAAANHGDGNGTETEREVAVGRCHELAIGNASSIIRKTQHRCEVCGKECLSGQALGGHMRKHRKLSPHNGGRERTPPELAGGAGHGHEKAAVAVRHGKSHGDGTLGAEACHQIYVDSSSGDSNSNSNGEQMFIGVANHGGGNGTEREVAVGRCHELAIGNASSIIVRKTHHRCEVCGKECLSGQALGGHMRKHRKRSPQDDGGKERTSPEADRITNQRGVVITNTHYGNRFDGSLIGWV